MVSIFNKIFSFSKKEKQVPIERDQILLHYEPIGSTGTSVYAGYMSEDYLNDLKGVEKADVFDEMRRGDPQVKMLLSSIKNPIKSASWEVVTDGEDEQSLFVKEFIEFILFQDLNKPFKQIIGEILTMVEFGHSVFEVVHKVDNHKKFGNYNGIRSLSWRSPKTIHRWHIDKQTEKLLSIDQYAYGDLGKVVKIPAEFLIVFNIDQEGSNYEGVSMLRSCYGNWKRKNLELKLNIAGIEKYAIPCPIAKVPQGKYNTEEYRSLIKVLENYTSHQKNYITVPSGWDITLNSQNSYDPSKVDLAIDSEDKRMSKAFLANFLELGMNGTGSYSLSNDLSDFFLSGLEHIADEISDKINKILIPQLIKLNFGEVEFIPQLKYSNISDKAGKELAEVFTMLSSSKIIIPDNDLEDHVRMRYKLPPRSEDGQRNQQTTPQFNNQQDQNNNQQNKFSEKYKKRLKQYEA